MIEKIFQWAWVNGLDVSLSSQSFEAPWKQSIYENRDEPDFSKPVVVKHMPELTFSRGDKHVKIVAYSWFELMNRLKNTQRHIFADLSCVLMEELE